HSHQKLPLINYFASLGSRLLEPYELNELKQPAVNLNQIIAKRNRQIAAFYHFTCWRITWTLRIVRGQLIRCRRVAEFALLAIQRGGGLKSTFMKAIRLYLREGLAGIKRGFRGVAASQLPNHFKDID